MTLPNMLTLNVFMEELPDERQSRFLAFAGGASVYAALLLFTA
jgi:sulfite exporter TauE/SafE